MAVLDASQLANLRKRMQREWITPTDFNKSIVNATIQALEDWYEGERSVVSGLMNTASSPKSFTNAEKKLIAKQFLAWKNEQGG